MGTKSNKLRTVFRCASCGASSPKWVGQCTTCEEWNTFAEEIDSPLTVQSSLAPTFPATPIDQIDPGGFTVVPTGLAELDRVLGGGLVPGSVTLVGGEPGIGKSTLLLQLLGSVASVGKRALLVSGEESRAQVHLRATRLGVASPNLWLASETALPEICAQIMSVRPDVVVIDSIQTLFDPQLGSAPGSVGQVRECANALVRLAKNEGITTLLVGHVTKEGSLAGPRVLEHVVDTVLSFDGDRHHALRLLRAVKHRFGATGELGLFEMNETGLDGVADPSSMFLGDRHHGASGSVVTCAMEGARPLLVEMQALVTESSLSFPRRAASGLDANRLALFLAVLEQRAFMKSLSFCDVFATAVGGVRITEPAVDLPVCLAIASAYAEVAFPSDAVAIGEIGLAGEVRSTAHIGRRLAEAARLGFARAFVPKSAPDITGIQLVRVGTLREAVDQLGLSVGSTKGSRQAATRAAKASSEAGSFSRARGGYGGQANATNPDGGERAGRDYLFGSYDPYADKKEQFGDF